MPDEQNPKFDYSVSKAADAAVVLGHFRHRGHSEWRSGYFQDSFDVAPYPFEAEPYNLLEEFEAIAIAEKYLSVHGITFLDLSDEITHSDKATVASETPKSK